MKPLLLHGSCVEVKGKAVLITGRPGAGKSSLALQLIDRGAILVSDDQTCLTFDEGKVFAEPQSTIKGLLEVRGLGFIQYPIQEKSPLFLCVDICDEAVSERLPEHVFVEYHDKRIPLLRLNRGDPLGAIKIELKISQRDESHVF